MKAHALSKPSIFQKKLCCHNCGNASRFLEVMAEEVHLVHLISMNEKYARGVPPDHLWTRGDQFEVNHIEGRKFHLSGCFSLVVTERVFPCLCNGLKTQ